MQRYCNTDFHQEKFETPEDSPEFVENEQQLQQRYLPSVKQFLSQPNPLMKKVEFQPYHPKCYFPRALGKLPKCLRDFTCIQDDKNNMNSILESVHNHNKLKRNVLNVLTMKNKRGEAPVEKKYLKTLQEYYEGQTPIYQRYGSKEMKLQQCKVKLKYFATYVLDMAKIIKKQMRIRQKSSAVNTATGAVLSVPRPSTGVNSKSTQYQSLINARQYRTPHTEKHLSTSRRQTTSNPINRAIVEFDSNFESGNLFQVYHKEAFEYDLILQNDINTKGNNQWFFFSAKNIPKNTTIRFNLVNMSKKTSLYNIGMKPYVFSMMRYEKRKISWVREGMQVSYEQSEFLLKESNKKPYNQLSFSYKNVYQGDVLYFCHSIPYGLTDLSSYLDRNLSAKDPKKNNLQNLVRFKHLGHTLGSNEIDLIQITNFSNSNSTNQKKKAIWITARQHSGETTSGFMLEGIIDFLISECSEAKFLLNNFVFKIVPMINVDGVIHGNSRAELIGSDPNRRWFDPNKMHNPIIHSLKHYIEKDKNSIEMFLDLHSHSRKLGTFFYGNTSPSNTAASRIYPLMVCKSDKRFSYKNCRFSGGNNRTARHVLFQSLKIPLIYTIESSFYGYQPEGEQSHVIKEYTPSDYNEMGKALMTTFVAYEVKKMNRSSAIGRESTLLRDGSSNTFCEQNQVGLENSFDKQQLDEAGDSESMGSDQAPSEDEYDKREFKKLINKNIVKKRKMKPIIDAVKLRSNLPTNVQTVEVIKKRKSNTSESHYVDYFSGRNSVKRPTTLNNKQQQTFLERVQKQTCSFGVQVNLRIQPLLRSSSREGSLQHGIGNYSSKNVLTERNYATKIPSTKPMIVPSALNNLCVIGQKVEEISIFGNTVGVQTSEQNREIFASRAQTTFNNGRKSFSVRTKPLNFLQIKENNFLQRGELIDRNFFAKR